MSKQGRNGLPICAAANAQGWTVEGYAYGAHATSWKTPGGEELLFVSDKAIFNPPKAIRGGIPVCLPQFAKLGPLQQHGFARNTTWDVVSEDAAAGAASQHGLAACFCMKLDVTDAMREAYSYDGDFVATLWTGLDEAGSLVQVLEVANRGTAALPLTCALHTYFRVKDIAGVKVEGLRGCSYQDSLDGGAVKQEAGAVTFGSEVDRVYMKVPGPVQIVDGAAKRTLELSMEGFVDAVVWNQWADKAAAMADFGDEEYKDYVCVEAAVAGSGPVNILPGTTWVGKQVVKVEST